MHSSFSSIRWFDLIAMIVPVPSGTVRGDGPRGKVGPRGSRGRALTVILACLPLHAADYWIAPPDSTNIYTGTASNCSPSNPMPYRTANVQGIILNNPKDPPAPDANLYFKPGLYLIDQLVASYPTARKLKLAPYPDATEPVVLRWQVPTNNPGYGPTNLLASPGSWDPFFFTFLAVMERFEMTNLVIDVNWPAWAATSTVASAAFPDGFKLSALWVQANEGLLQGVKVKNCGASGRVPAPNWNGAGAEAFPIYVQPRDYLRNHPDPAWIIEDCEVSDFHAVHGGYATMIMVQPSDPDRYTKAATNTQHRVACVRHCFISGNGAGIGFGSAGSVGVIFYQNLLSDLHDGFNFDTASEAEPLRYFDITNNVFLDVHTLGNIGAAGTCGFFSDFTVSQNAVRLRGVPLEQDYTDFRWTNQVFGSWSNRMPVTDVSLAVGRFATGACHGLRLAGASNIVFADNRFTTWPQTNFFLPDPGNTGAASFCPLWLPTQVEESQAWICPSTVLSFSGTRLSGTAFDFGSFTIPDPNFVTNGVDAIGANPPGFEPWGRVGRLTLSLNCPTAVREVSVGKPGLVAGKVQVRARIVRHKLGGPYDTESELPNNLRLLVIAGGTSNVVQPTVQGYLADFEFTPTANTHYELIVYQDEEPPGFDADRESWARTEYDHGTVVRFERTPDVANDRRLIAGQLNLVRTGTNTPLVVKLRSAPTNQVGRPALAGDDFDLYYSSGSPVPTNNGVWSCTMNGGSQVLRVVPRSGTNNQDVAEYEAAYFEIVEDPTNYGIGTSGWGVSGLSYLEGTHTHPVAAVTLWDGPKYRHYELTSYFWYDCGGQSAAPLLADAPSAWDGMAEATALGEGEADPATVEVEDIPMLRFTRLPLDEAVWGQPGAQDAWPEPSTTGLPESDLLALGGAMLASGQCYLSPLFSAVYDLNSTNLTRMAGVVTYNNNGAYAGGPTPYFTLGGQWVATNYQSLVPVGTPWSSPLLYGVDHAGNLVGQWGSRACWVSVSTPTNRVLQSISSSRPGQALSLVPQGGVAVGWSSFRTNNTDYARPTRWDVNTPNVAEDLGAFDGNPTTVGYAYTINSNLVTVGKTRIYSNSVAGWRAFRTIPGMDTNRLGTSAAQALGLPVYTNNLVVTDNWANGVNRSDDAVGATEHWRAFLWGTTTNRLETRLAVWWAGNSTPYGMDVCLEPVPAAPYDRSGRSEALAINRQGNRVQIVGTAWATPYGYARAFVLEAPRLSPLAPDSVNMLNLNDPHLSWISGTWLLTTAEAINDAGVIVGNGTLNTEPRGWVLVPQSVATP